MSRQRQSSGTNPASGGGATAADKVLVSSRNEFKYTPFEHTFTVGDVTKRIKLLNKRNPTVEFYSEALVVKVDNDLTFTLHFEVELYIEGRVGAFLSNSDSSPSAVAVEMRADVVKPSSTSYWRRHSACFQLEDRCGWDVFISKEEMETRKGEFLRGDTLVIEFSGSLLTEQHSSTYSERPTDATPDCKAALARDLADFRRKKGTCDVTIFCEDHWFPVHGFVLRMRSDVFAAMLDTDMKEKRSGQIKVKDVKPKIMEALIAYMYGEGSPDSEAIELEDLLAAADKYIVASLVQECAKAMAKKLDRSTCIRTVIAGDKYKVDSLKKRAMDFILGCGCSPGDLPDFAKLKNFPELKMQIADHVLQNRQFKKQRTN